MPIYINLLAESQAAEDTRRRDPFKWALYAAGFIVFIFIAWGGLATGQSLVAKEKLGGLQTQINARTNTYQHAMADLRKVADARNKLAALDKLQGARFLQGNLLNALQLTYADGVQLNRLQLDQTYTAIGEAPKITGVREHVLLHLYARDYSANPGDQVNKYKAVIARQPYFQSMLDKTNAVQLAGPPSTPLLDNNKSYVAFALECRFRDQVRQ